LTPGPPLPVTLRTPRLRLEPLNASHAAAMFEGLQHEALYEFISEPPPESVDALRERYERLAKRMSPDGQQAWLNWVICAVPPGSPTGYVQATVFEDHSADVAYLLFRESWGRGYAREATTAMIDHLRDDWETRRIRASVDTRNQRSIALLEALGFTRGALRANAEWIRGVLTDEVGYWLEVG